MTSDIGSCEINARTSLARADSATVVACKVAVQGALSLPHVYSGCVGLAEYRLDDLARVSGVSPRNIRAYRERGLLDPPRRVGRSAYYDDFHLSQLKTINQLLRKGFNSAHIAEFFAGIREGHNLAELLGLQQAILGHRPGQLGEAPQEPPQPGSGEPAGTANIALDLDPGCDEARRLVELGLGNVVDVAIVLADPTLREIVARSQNQLLYVQVILHIFESTRETIDQLAAEVIDALRHRVTFPFGPNLIPKPEELIELSRTVRDCRELGSKVVGGQLDEALQRQMVDAVSDYTAELMLSGRWESTDH